MVPRSFSPARCSYENGLPWITHPVWNLGHQTSISHCFLCTGDHLSLKSSALGSKLMVLAFPKYVLQNTKARKLHQVIYCDEFLHQNIKQYVHKDSFSFRKSESGVKSVLSCVSNELYWLKRFSKLFTMGNLNVSRWITSGIRMGLLNLRRVEWTWVRAFRIRAQNICAALAPTLLAFYRFLKWIR